MAQDVPGVSRMYDLVNSESRKLSELETYKTAKSELDLIFYITRTMASLITEDEIDLHGLSILGWRSISCINAKQAVVLYANESAPKFLKRKLKQIIKPES